MGTPFAKLRTGDDHLDRVQDNIGNTFAPLIASQIGQGNLLSGVSLTTGAVNLVSHKLARAPLGWQIVGRRSSEGGVMHAVGSTGEPAYKNGWSTLDAGHNIAGFQVRGDGSVILQGNVTGGTVATNTTGTIFTLPAHLWPAKEIATPGVISNGALGACVVDVSGNVRAHIGSSANFSLEGLTFQAASPNCAAAEIWDDQTTGTQQAQFLRLWSAANVTADIWVF